MSIEKLYQLFLQSSGVTTDTRNIKVGTIFFALKGENFNANTFAEEALKNGCAYAVVDEEKYAVDDRIILVDNSLKALQNLANYHRKQFTIPVLGITGSNGKTTTKELIGAVLETTYNVLVTSGNFNNHIGVPLTLLNLNIDHEIAIIEMGANKPGDIQELCEIAEPTHGIITNIGAAHIEGFGSIQGVIKTKTEMFRFINSVRGILFLNWDDEVLKNNLPGNYEVVTYGLESGDVQGSVEKLDPYLNFSWRAEDYKSEVIKSNLVGNYNILNFLAAICIGRFFNVEAEKMNKSLSSYAPTNNRSQIEKTKRNTLIVDCYNANATSMQAALENFVAMSGENKLAILGGMRELGDISIAEHQKIADFLADKKIDVRLIGTEFDETKTQFIKYNAVADYMANEKVTDIANQLILLKGSRGIKLENLISSL